MTTHGGRVWVGDEGGLVGSEDALRNVSLASLRAAALRAGRYLGDDEEMNIQLYPVDQERLRADDSAFIAPAYDLTFIPSATLLNIALITDVGYRLSKPALLQQLARALRRRKVRVWEVKHHERSCWASSL